MIVFWILVAWLVACVIFTLGYVFGAMMEATRPRGAAIDLSGAAARGELDRLTNSKPWVQTYPSQGEFVDEVGRHAARERTERF